MKHSSYLCPLPTVEVILSPALCDTFDPSNKNIVVVDIFRATSTIASALMFGAKAVLPVLKAEETIRQKENGYLIAGERDGKQIEGFDFGNSPKKIQDDRLKNGKLALTTTNGTKCFTWAQQTKAHEILSGSFLNLKATAAYLIEQNMDVIILCAGWKNRVNMEDSLFAGALCKKLLNHFKTEGDGSLIAMNIESQALGMGYLNYLKSGSHYQRLKGFGAEADMDFCLQQDRFNKVISLQDNHLITIG